MKICFCCLLLSLCTVGYTPFSENDWHTNIDTAKEIAQQNDQAILMVFAGSDWCRPCMKFKKDILQTDAFQAFAEKEVLILYLDFPARKKNRLSKEQTKHNELLAEKYNNKGLFPHLVLLDSEARLLSNMKYAKQTPEEFVGELQAILQQKKTE